VSPVSVKTAMLVSHMHPENSSGAVADAAAAAAASGVKLYAPEDEFSKHGAEAMDAIAPESELEGAPDVCLVLGGDGSILYALRRFSGTGVPIFGINFGTVGFLAASEREDFAEGLRRAYAGEFEVMSLPGLELGMDIERPVALNDVTFIRQPHGRVAELSYRIAGEEVGHVRCDGLVAATPAGSTGYNLANAGPILAWGVKGFVVSFIAPHTLTARALVVAPSDVLHVRNAAGREPVHVELDGDHSCQLEAGQEVEVRFRDGVSHLAQYEGANFYTRIREKFGRLAQ
jgi:NAD+ kinase